MNSYHKKQKSVCLDSKHTEQNIATSSSLLFSSLLTGEFDLIRIPFGNRRNPGICSVNKSSPDKFYRIKTETMEAIVILMH